MLPFVVIYIVGYVAFAIVNYPLTADGPDPTRYNRVVGTLLVSFAWPLLVAIKLMSRLLR